MLAGVLESVLAGVVEGVLEGVLESIGSLRIEECEFEGVQ